MSSPQDITPDPHAHPMREMVRIAGPTVTAMTSYTVMTFTDKWLVSHLGAEYVGAQGNGGLAAWVASSLMYGVLQVINTYVSQNLGAGRPRAAAAYAWNGLWLAAAFAVLLVPYGFALPMVFRAAEMDAAQADLATQYGRILVFGAFLNLATRALSQFFYGMQRAIVITVAGVAANVVNVVVSCVLVFGTGPMPPSFGWFGDSCAWLARAGNIEPMGIAGSAWGTILATGVELAIPLAVFLGPRMNELYATRRAWRPSWSHVRDILRLGWPSGLMFANEMICWGYFMVYLVSHFGVLHASAGWIAHQYMSLSFMPAVGISVACTALVGKYMGMKRPDLAARYAWLGVKLAMAYMGICGVVFVVFRAPLVRLFIEADTPPAEADEIVRLGSLMLIATAAFQLFDATAMVLAGSLRGAGDTVFPGVATIIASWGVIVGLGTFLVHRVPSLESLGAWIGAAAYIAVLCLLLLARFIGGRWKSINLLKDAARPQDHVQGS